jgi:hypothetical protein
MIERTFDAAFFNRICNLPEVRPMLGGQGEIDVSAVVESPANYALRTEHGGFILSACGAGFYSVHTQFSAEGRGQHAVAAMRAGLDFMFTRTDCMKIFSHCPDNNPAASALARAGGARPWFRNELEPHFGSSQVVSWDLFDWIVKTPELEAEGEEFHAVSEAAMKQAKIELPAHPHDPIHNRAVGATVRMCRAGQVKKGVLSYNLWACAAGYPQARFISDEPPTIDAGMGMIVSMTPSGEMQVLQCPSV